MTVGADGWFHYTKVLANSLHLQGATTRTINGKHAAGGGCMFDDGASKATSRSVNGYSEEVAFNPKTCQESVIEGTLTASGLATLRAASPATSAGAVTGMGPSPRGTKGEVIPNLINYSAFEKVSWVDPADITITSLANNLSWNSDGSSNLWASYNGVPYAFAYDGWSSTGVSGSWGGCVGAGCTSIEASVTDTWHNTDFEAVLLFIMGPSAYAACGFDDSPADFYLNPYIYGYSNGTYSWGHGQSANGGCSDLVHFRENHGGGSSS
ncbi:hypothetical protein [Catenulispora sp. GP43]|uniref:hypothetical protein n=1 Tax=Catenulispora sp. GP43 TaxID=3156263 RepID=UPI0035134A9F